MWPAVRTRIAERRAKPWWSRLHLERGAFAPVAATLAIILVAGLLLTPRFADSLGHVLSIRSEEHTSELQSLRHLVCRLLLEKKKHIKRHIPPYYLIRIAKQDLH